MYMYEYEWVWMSINEYEWVWMSMYVCMYVCICVYMDVWLTLPMELRKLSGSVPPILLKKTICLTPAFFAASIWFFAPIQSTLYGEPLGKVKVGLPCRRKSFIIRTLIMEKKLILGTALVHNTSLSTPCRFCSRASGSSTLQTFKFKRDAIVASFLVGSNFL